MAIDTKKNLRSQVMYSVFVRNHSRRGTFEGVRRDLDRIAGLGTDILWLMPIHPIGEAGRKGTLGSPYAIRDYRAVNPEFGDMEDFRRLVDAVHERGMKCIIDVVYNHTSPDSWLAQHHPEWFYHRPDGSFCNRIGDWSDVIDLDYSQPALWDYQIETLTQWAGLVDGFRCDVAPLVPLEFWLRARREVAQVRQDCLWMAESVEPEFIMKAREEGVPMLSDGEIFQAFDVSYEYDVYQKFLGALTGENSLEEYARAVNRQEWIYPDNYVKLRFLENHDRARAHFLVPEEKALENWTAFLYFQKGLVLLYGGQETGCTHRPGLFDRDPVDWSARPDLEGLMTRLAGIRRDPLFADSRYQVQALDGGILLARHRKGGRELLGVFSTAGRAGAVPVDLPDGLYENLVDGRAVEVYERNLSFPGGPVILKNG